MMNTNFFDKGTLYLLIGTVVSFAAGLLVTFVTFTKGQEFLIFPGIPFAVVGILFYWGQKQKNKAEA